MSKKDKEMLDVEATDLAMSREALPHEGDGIVYASIILKDDGYHVVDQDGTEGPVCKLVDEGEKTIALTKNASNRKWFNRKKADEAIAESGSCPLYYKGTKANGPRTASKSVRDPLAKLVPYMSEEDVTAYRAIMERAVAAMEADAKKPLTDVEKAQLALEKAKAKYEALIAAQTAGNTEEV